MAYIIERADGTTQEVSGYRYKPAGRDVRRSEPRGGNLPRKVDLRRHMSDIEDQGALNSCTANAVAGAYEYLVRRHWGDDAYDVSRLFVYFNARAEDDDEDVDEGTPISSAIQGLQVYGACSEEAWPYDEDAVNVEPHDDAYYEAAHFLIEDVELVPTDLETWKQVLSDGYPIVFGLLLYNSFDKQRRRGLVPRPTKKERTRGEHGAHAMLCVGYSDRDEVFLVRNSWGRAWGDEGYCYIPYSYLMSDKHNLEDSWIIRQIEEIEPEPEPDDDDSIIGTLGGILSALTDAVFGEVIDAMDTVPLEVRIGLVMLCAAGADGELSDEEIEELVAYMEHVLETLGIDNADASGVLEQAMDRVDDEDLVEESVAVIGDNLPRDALAAIVGELFVIAEADGLDEDEEDFVHALVEAWQLE